MLIALHKCECGEPDCDARGLAGFGENPEALANSIFEHWSALPLTDPNFATFEVYSQIDTLTIQRSETFSIVKAN